MHKRDFDAKYITLGYFYYTLNKIYFEHYRQDFTLEQTESKGFNFLDRYQGYQADTATRLTTLEMTFNS
jgi:hypothetical protein